MLTLAVLFAAAVLAGEPAHHAGAHPASAANSAAKANQHALEQERKMLEQSMHRQMEAEKQMMHAQQRTVHDQMKAEIQAQAHNTHLNNAQVPFVASHSSGYAGRPYGSINQPYNRGHHSHHRTYPYQHHQTWPMGQDRELAALHALKQSLDNVHHGLAATSSPRQGIERALMRVVEVSRPPSIASVDRLAGHLATALATREAPTIDTSPMALALRSGVNAPYLINAERAQVFVELQTAMKHGGVRANEITLVVEALKNVEHQEHARR